MREPLTRDDLTFLFFCCVFACIIAEPIHQLARAIEDYTATYREKCILPGTIPDRPDSSSVWELKWVDKRKVKR